MSRTFLYRPAFCSSLRSGCHRHGRAYGVDAGAVARTVDVGAAVGDVVPVGDVDAVGEGVGEGVWLTGTLGLGVAETVGLGDGADGLAGLVAGGRRLVGVAPTRVPWVHYWRELAHAPHTPPTVAT